MVYYIVRTVDTTTREFSVKADSKEEALLAAENAISDKTAKVVNVRKTHESTYASVETVETDAANWSAAGRVKKK